jgi:hypothetical protein
MATLEISFFSPKFNPNIINLLFNPWNILVILAGVLATIFPPRYPD